MRVFADEDYPEPEDCPEPEEEPPDDDLALTWAHEEWLRGQGLAAPEETGASGCGLVNAVRDAIIDDDLARLSDAELLEQAARSRELAARAAGRQYRTLTEFLRRRPPRQKSRRFDEQDARRDAEEAVPAEEGLPADAPHRPPVPAPGQAPASQPAPVSGPVSGPVLASEEAAGEIALAFTLTDYSAGTLTAMVADLACRLPRALEGLENGALDEARVKILWEYSRDLSEENARKFDASLSPRAGEMTTGELRDKARREQIRTDPEAAERRRRRGERSSRVVLYANDDHTATLGVENAPAGLAAAAKGRVGAIARAAKAAGAAGNLGLAMPL